MKLGNFEILFPEESSPSPEKSSRPQNKEKAPENEGELL
jgi:hypothetical protein